MFRGHQDNTVYLQRVGQRAVRVCGIAPDDVAVALRGALPYPVVVEDPPQRTSRSVDPALSARERAVVRLITLGESNDAIADGLFISVNTVKGYIRTAYRKMGVERRSQAVLWGVQHGLDAVPAHDEAHEAHDEAYDDAL